MAHETHELHENPGIIYRDECYRIMGACFEVYKLTGNGFLEGVFQECLAIELTLRGIPHEQQRQFPLTYKNVRLVQHYKADFICFDKIILEIKAASELVNEHRAQVLNYLSATGFRLGILVNFGHHPKLEWERIVR